MMLSARSLAAFAFLASVPGLAAARSLNPHQPVLQFFRDRDCTGDIQNGYDESSFDYIPKWFSISGPADVTYKSVRVLTAFRCFFEYNDVNDIPPGGDLARLFNDRDLNSTNKVLYRQRGMMPEALHSAQGDTEEETDPSDDELTIGPSLCYNADYYNADGEIDKTVVKLHWGMNSVGDGYSCVPPSSSFDSGTK